MGSGDLFVASRLLPWSLLPFLLVVLVHDVQYSTSMERKKTGAAAAAAAALRGLAVVGRTKINVP